MVEIESGCLAEKVQTAHQSCVCVCKLLALPLSLLQAGVEPGDCLVELCGEPVYQMQHQKVSI